jgi:bifunctional enzyme CysN/CysC
VPTSARDGDNVVDAPEENMPWWDGPTVLEELDRFDRPEELTERPLRFPIQDIYRFDNRRILAGRIESGELEVGQKLVFTPHQKTARVETIEAWNAPSPDSAQVGESIGITLDEEIFVERGHVAADAGDDVPPAETTKFRANLFWLGKEPLKAGEPYKLKLGPIAEECSVESIERIMDGANLEPIEEERTHINRYDVAEVILETRRPISVDRYIDHPTVGRFVIVDEYDVAGGGIIEEAVATESEKESKLRRVTQGERAERAGHEGAFVELHAADADRLAVMLERTLFDRGINAMYLDHVPKGIDQRQLANYLAKSGAVTILPIEVDTDGVEIVLNGGERAAVNIETEEDIEALVDSLLPHLRGEDVEARIQASV